MEGVFSKMIMFLLEKDREYNFTVLELYKAVVLISSLSKTNLSFSSGPHVCPILPLKNPHWNQYS